jgi:hypothetical protein
MSDTIKRIPDRRRYDQSSDVCRQASVSWIDKNLYRDVRNACDVFLKKRGLSEKSWYDKEPESDVMDSPTPPTPTPPHTPLKESIPTTDTERSGARCLISLRNKI